MDRQERARKRRGEWQWMALDQGFDAAPDDTPGARLRRMEALRRTSFAMLGIDYPEGPTPKAERSRWPIDVRP